MNNFRGISYYLKANREPGEISTLYLIQVGNILGAMVWFPLYLTLPLHTITQFLCVRLQFKELGLKSLTSE